jgi:hypothetical protein
MTDASIIIGASIIVLAIAIWHLGRRIDRRVEKIGATVADLGQQIVAALRSIERGR